MALGVTLGADIAGPRQVREHLRHGHGQLAFQPARCLRPLLSLAGPPPLAPPLGLRRLRLRLRLSRASIAISIARRDTAPLLLRRHAVFCGST